MHQPNFNRAWLARESGRRAAALPGTRSVVGCIRTPREASGSAAALRRFPNDRGPDWGACFALTGIIPSVLVIFFTAGCASPAPAPWKFAVFCDGRSDRADDPGAKDGVRWASIKAMAAHAASQHVEPVVFPGDPSNGATNFGTLEHQWTAWRKDMAPLYDAGIPVYPVRGNHETHQSDSMETWRKIFSELPQNGPQGQEGLTYKVETRNACFIAIDEFAGQPPTSSRSHRGQNRADHGNGSALGD